VANEAALKAIKTAVYSTLHGDSTLQGLLAESILDGSSAVFDDVPENQEYPLILIGGVIGKPWHTFGGASVGKGWDDRLTIHIYSRYQGDKEALEILDRVVALLDYASLSVTGYNTAICRLDERRVLVEQVNKIETYHVHAVFRWMVHQ
jgi:hypothetical protein